MTRNSSRNLLLYSSISQICKVSGASCVRLCFHDTSFSHQLILLLYQSKPNGRFFFSGMVFRVFDRGQNNCYFNHTVKNTNVPQKNFAPPFSYNRHNILFFLQCDFIVKISSWNHVLFFLHILFLILILFRFYLKTY